MIKTMPKAIKVLCSFVLAMIVAGVGWKFLASPLLTYSDKTANYIGEVLQIPPPLEKTQTAFTWAYYTLCAALYCFILWTIKTFTAWLWARRLARVGLKNPQGETPRLRTIKKHKDKKQAIKGWIVYRFIPFGFSDEDFRQKSARLVGIFRGRVGECSPSDNFIELNRGC